MTVSHAARALGRRPQFSAAVIAILALGLGAVAAVFTAVSAFFWHPLPLAEPDRLMAVYETLPDGSASGVSLQAVEDWIESSSPVFSGFAAYRLRSFGYRAPDTQELEIVQVGRVTGDFLTILGAKLTRGRDIRRDEAIRNDRLVVLSHQLRVRSFPLDAPVIGERIELNETPYTVVGVLAPEFEFFVQPGRSQTMGGGRVPDAYIPLPYADFGGRRRVRTLGAVARLSDGSDISSARTEISLLAQRLSEEYPETSRGFGARLVPIQDAIHGPNRRPVLWTLGAAVALLAIAVVNAVSLVRVRWLKERNSLSILASLGASTGSLYARVLAECLLLCGAASVVGIWIASLFVDVLRVLFPLLGGFESQRLSVDLLSGGLIVSVGLGVAVFMSLTILPLLLTTGSAIPGGSKWNLPSAKRRPGTAIAVQVSVSVALLLGAGVLLRSMQQVLNQESGFQTDRVVQFGIGLPEQRYDSGSKLIDFHRRFSEALSAIPGVNSATISGVSIPFVRTTRLRFDFETESREPADEPRAVMSIVGPGYFPLLEIPLRAGRGIAWDEGPEEPRVVLVSESFIEHHGITEWHGKRLRLSWRDDLTSAGSLWEIVGIVGDVRNESLEAPPEPTIYLSASQVPLEGGRYWLRTSRTDAELYAEIESAKRALDRDLQALNPLPFHETVTASVAHRRFSSLFAASFAAVALGLCCIGVFGSVSTELASRWREVGVRLALGESYATSRVRFVVGVASYEGLGIGFGVAIYWLVSAGLSSQLFGIDRLDPMTLVTALCVVAVTTLVASLLPLRGLERQPLIDLLRE